MKTSLPLLAVLVLAVLTLGACSTATYGPESPYYTWPSGSRLALTRPLTIPAGAATVRLQGGSPVARNAVQEMLPYCVFEVDTVSEAPQVVEPRSFDVVEVWREVRDLAAAAPPAPGLVTARFVSDAGPSHLYYKTIFRLHDDGTPRARRLVCESDQLLQPAGQPLTLAQIRGALGDWFRVLPGMPDTLPPAVPARPAPVI